MTPVARPQAHILRDLIALDARVRERPHAAFGLEANIRQMAAEIERAVRQVRVIDEASVMLICALAAVAETGDRVKQVRFCTIAGALMPHIREDLAVALREGLRP